MAFVPVYRWNQQCRSDRYRVECFDRVLLGAEGVVDGICVRILLLECQGDASAPGALGVASMQEEGAWRGGKEGAGVVGKTQCWERR